MWRCKEQPTACSGITCLFRGAPVHCMAEEEEKKLDFTRYPSDHPDHMESDCGSFADHQQCLGKAGKSREEREDTKHTQAITMYDKKLPSLVIIRREREREEDRGQHLSRKDSRIVSLPSLGGQADRSRFLWSRRRRSSNCKLYINRK